MLAKMSRTTAILTAAALVAVLAAPAAQAKNEDQAAALFLLYPPGARELACGGAGVASATGPHAAWYNPALLAHEGAALEANGTYYRVFQPEGARYSARVACVAATVRSGFGTLAIGLQRVKQRDLWVMEDVGGDSPYGLAITISGARRIGERFSFGVTAKFIQEKIAAMSVGPDPVAHGFAVDLGAAWQVVGYWSCWARRSATTDHT